MEVIKWRAQQSPLPETKWMTYIRQMHLQTSQLCCPGIVEDFLKQYIYQFWTFDGLLDLKVFKASDQREVLVLWSWEDEASYFKASQSDIYQSFLKDLAEKCSNKQLTIINELENNFEIIE